MSTTIKPKGHFILIKPDDVEEKDEVLKGAKEAGIYIPENDMKRERAATQTGVIVAVGPMAWKAFDRDDPDWQPWAVVGERVFFQKYVQKEITDESTGEMYFVLADENIIAGVE